MRRLKPPGLLRRMFALALLAWVAGFLWFSLFMPRAADEAHTDAVIVLTGGTGRIAHGLDELRAGHAARMLVSGVGSEVTQAQFAKEYGVSPALLACCLTLGYDSFDTWSNAREAAAWIARNNVHSVRLVTTDWHMRRAAFDLNAAAPRGLVIVEDAVASHPSLKVLFVEYNKFVARVMAWLVGWHEAAHHSAIGHGRH